MNDAVELEKIIRSNLESTPKKRALKLVARLKASVDASYICGMHAAANVAQAWSGSAESAIIKLIEETEVPT